MSVIVATREEIQKYYESEALGQSKLKLLLEDVSSFNREFDSSAEHFLIGSAVDCILTDSRETFNEIYYTSEVENLPSDTLVEILKHVYEDLLEDYAESLTVVVQEEETPQTTFSEFVGELGNWRAYIVDACTKVEWQPRWGVDAKYDNIVKNCSAYFEDLCKSFGKTVISKNQAKTINSIVNSLETNPRTQRFFARESLESLTEVEVYYQLPIYFEYRGVPCKALLDMVVVVREKGMIISVTPIDLKTMNGNTYHFPSSIKKRRYDIQAAWYTMALIHYFNLDSFPERIKPFLFVVESTSYQGKPLCFEVSESLLEIGTRGKEEFFAMVDGRREILKSEVLGYEQLVDKYLYHIENGFNEEKEIQESGLTPIKVDWNGIT